MNHPITWGEYISVRLLIWAGAILIALMLAVIAAIRQYCEDIHVNDDPKETFEPHAGKTLGL
jgi:hypothetical protein